MSPLALIVLLPLVPGTLLCLWCGRANSPARRAVTACIAAGVAIAVLGLLAWLAGPVFDGQTLLTQAEWVLAIGLNANYRLDGLWRLLRGPAITDRVLALDTLYVNAVALAILLGIRLGTVLLFEAALIIAMLGFVSTVALGRYLARGDVIE